jgi:hypothetical protein
MSALHCTSSSCTPRHQQAKWHIYERRYGVLVKGQNVVDKLCLQLIFCNIVGLVILNICLSYCTTATTARHVNLPRCYAMGRTFKRQRKAHKPVLFTGSCGLRALQIRSLLTVASSSRHSCYAAEIWQIEKSLKRETAHKFTWPRPSRNAPSSLLHADGRAP